MVAIASQQAIQETGVEIKCPLMHKYIVSGTYDHNGGVLTSRDGIKITIPKVGLGGILVLMILTVSHPYWFDGMG